MRRLTALEGVAERVRARELHRQLEHDARAQGMRPDLIAGHVERLLAVEVGLDPESFAREMAEAWERETGGVA